MTKKNDCPIAIVGISSLMPGSIHADGFWRDILGGKDLITDVPASHWLIEDYYDPDPTVPDKTYAKRGAFLPDVDFDPMAWGVPPNIVPATDTNQLLALIVAKQVLEDAARGQFQDMDREKMSIMLGVTSAQELLGSMVSRLQKPIWVKALRDAGLPESEVQNVCARISAEYTPWQESTFPGVLGNVVAGRIANRLDLHGTNCVTDAACASTFSALSMAVNELRLGDSDLAIAGGADTMNDIFMYMCFSKTPALSPSGDCRPFSDQADGTMLGEGIAMVALKRLSDAERDGDRVYAVITGVGTSSDGRSKSVYAPVPEGQARALRRAYDLAGYGPDTVELVEAHGTGTKAGDAAEFGGLDTVWNESGRQDRQWCALGSVKSQIGHTKAAAGAAGLVKAVLALHNKVLPPTTKVDAPNPKLKLEQSAFYLPTKARPWVRGSDHPRRASVSSFGFGGSNFHIALEEYTGASARQDRTRAYVNELVVVTGGSPADVAAKCRALAAEVEACTDAGMLQFLAQTSQLAFDAAAAQQGARVAVVAKSEAELVQKLRQAAELADKGVASDRPGGVSFGVGALEGGVALLFPGQGSQYVEMGREIAVSFEEVRSAWDTAASLALATEKLHDVVFPRSQFTADEQKRAADKLTATEWAQPAIGTHSLGLLRLLRALGVTPAAVGGHSFGEVMALAAAGAISESDAIRIARRRGELMRDAAQTPGSMLAVTATVEVLRPKLEAYGEDVVIANHNAPEQVVLSGPTAAIDAVEAKLKADGLRATRLSVATAFHSKVVSASTVPFKEFLADIAFTAPSVPVYANSEAAPYPADPGAARAILGQQIAEPVRFVEQVRAMHAAGCRTFVEVGPGSVLTGLVGRILGDLPHSAIALDRKGKDGEEALVQSLAKLVAAGVPMTLAPLSAGLRVAEDPRSRVKPKMALKINGSNYDKPYPPKGGAAALPKPNPERVIAPVVAAAPAKAPAPSAPAMTRAAAPAAAHTEPAVARVAPAPVAQPVPVAQPAPVPAPVAQSPVGASSDWLAAYAAIQQQTAEAHSAFQSAMAQSHSAFLQSAQTSVFGMTTLAGVGVAAPAPAAFAAPVAAPVFAAHAPAMHVAPAAAAPVAPAPVAPAPAAPAPAVAAPAPAPVVAAPAPVRAAAPAPVQAAPVAAAKSVTAPAPGRDLRKLMLQVVSDKTGYPEEMLGLEMDLEADLGVDSIKRVEILSTMREREPGLPDVDAGEMAKLRTLGEIVAYMGASGPVGASAAPAAVAPAAVVAKTAAPGRDLHKLMLQVVSEKTGYPEEMLGLEMDLEADLGVDSIKRVEILSTMREREPGLPDVDAGEMAKLRTLGEIVAYMGASGSVGASAPAAAAPVAAAAPKAVGRDLHQLMLQVVSEKTGYPTEMLGLEMDLEADLGVDSIKRVEILSTMREREPGLPDVDAGEMAKLRTLGEIVTYMGGSASAAPAAPAAVAAAPKAAGRDLHQLMLQVVSEKTGYPTEMLGLEMDLEADLGVDSIKRVEILSTMREREPGLPDVDAGEMAKLRTLGEIVTYMGGSASAAPAAVAAPAPAAAAPKAAGRDLHQLMLQVVSEKTGYPTEMLGLEMDLEADLGVDSIKRVEILSTMREREPGLPDVDAGEMAKLRTLGEIVTYMGGSASAASSAPAGSASVAAPAAPSAPSAALGRFPLRLVSAPALGFSLPGLYRVKRLAITSEGTGVAEALAAQLASQGVRAEVVGAVSELAADVDGVIFLGGLSAMADVDAALAVQREAFLAAKRLAAGANQRPVVFVTVQDTGGDFGLGGSPRAWLGGLPGLVKTAALEWSDVGARAIDLDLGELSAADVGALIAQELLAGGLELEVALTPTASDKRRTLESYREDLDPNADATPRLGPTDVVLASGGARGVTARTLVALAQKTCARFVLLGRSPLTAEPASVRGLSADADLKRALLADAKARGEAITPAGLGQQVAAIRGAREVQQTLADIEAAGGLVRYVPVDVLDEAGIASALETVRAEWGPITAVVHGAGLLADKRIEDKTVEQFERVFRTKVDGLRVLLSATRRDPLKALVMFSSVAGRCGNQGQCDYAMANETLNKVAALEKLRRGGDLSVKSLNWGPWEGGMVTPELKAHFDAMGVPLIPLEVGARMLVDELRVSTSTAPVEIVLGGQPRPESLLDVGGAERDKVFDLRVHRATHPYLDHHRVKGVAVVPVVLVLEWFARAARAVCPELLFVGCRDVKVLKGITLPEFDGAGDRFEVHARKMSNGVGALYALELRSVSGTRHYMATAVLEPQRPTPRPLKAPPQDLGPIRPSVYAEDGSGVLFHGEDFRVVRDVQLGTDGLSALLVGTHEKAWLPDTWQTDPALLDGGLQLALLWTEHALGRASLPTGLGALHVYKPGAPAGELRATLHAREATSAKAVTDVSFVDAGGELVASLEGVETHVLP